MKVEDCIVSVERRTVAGCMDLAFVFAREFAGPLFRLTLACAAPSCLLVWCAAMLTTDMLLPGALIFLLFASLFNALLVAAAGPQVFGVSMSLRKALRMLTERPGILLATSFGYRFIQLLTSLCLLFPGVMMTAHFGHLPELILLERMPATQLLPRLNWLGRGGGYSRSLSRVLVLLAFWVATSAGLFVLADVLFTVLFNMPILAGHLTPLPQDVGAVVRSLADRPLFLTTIQAAVWIPLPLVRLTWFFCYLDQRIRKECWDMELLVQVESKRLKEAP